MASGKDVPALCRVSGEQMLYDAPLTLIATVLQSVAINE